MVVICVSVPATTTAEAIEDIRLLQRPDMVELRLDYAAEHINLDRLRASTGAALVATARLPGHGGRWAGGEVERQRLLLSAAEAGFEYVDAEADSACLGELVAAAHDRGASVVVSRHFADGTPKLSEALAVHGEAKAAGADVVKVVGTAMSPADNLPCLEYLGREPGNVGFAMGALGVPSRVLSPLMGGAWTYASSAGGRGVAPGQMTLADLRETYRLMGVAA